MVPNVPPFHKQQQQTTTTVPSALQADDDDNQNDNSIIQARLLLLGAAALYGTNFSIIKLLGDSLPVGLGSTLRFGMAALATSPWLLWNDNDQNDHSSNDHAAGAIAAGLEVGLWNAVGYVAQAVGLETTLASKSAFLCSLAVVVVPVLDMCLAKGKEQQQQQRPCQVVGIVLAIMGVALLELGGAVGQSSSANVLALSSGDLASLLQPLAFGVGFWRMEQAMRKFPNQAHKSTAAQLLAVFAGSALYMAVAEPAAEWSQLAEWCHDPMIWASLLWTGVISTALTVYMETVALKTLSAAETTLIFSSEPVWGSAVAALLLGERFGMDAVMGALLILTGCIVSTSADSLVESFRSLTSQLNSPTDSK